MQMQMQSWRRVGLLKRDIGGGWRGISAARPLEVGVGTLEVLLLSSFSPHTTSKADVRMIISSFIYLMHVMFSLLHTELRLSSYIHA